jgi:hypothetical protein
MIASIILSYPSSASFSALMLPSFCLESRSHLISLGVPAVCQGSENIRPFDDRPQRFIGDMGIYFGCGNTRMTEQSLNEPNDEGARGNMGANAEGERDSIEDLKQALIHPAAMLYKPQRRPRSGDLSSRPPCFQIGSQTAVAISTGTHISVVGPLLRSLQISIE